MGRKNRGAARAGAPELDDNTPDEAVDVSIVLVTNTRQGAIHVGQLTFTPGHNAIEAERFAAIPKFAQDALEDMVSEGWLKFGPFEPTPAPANPPALVHERDPLPTVEAVKASTNAAELDAWFHLPGLSADVSQAILARQSEISPA